MSLPVRLLACLLLVPALSGCGWLVHKIDIQQGNLVAPESFARVKVGMTKAEVRNVLGTPLLTDPFHANRWDYYFRNERGGRLLETNAITLWFEGDRLARIEGSPTASAAGTVPAPR
jgi:outer membrane protein assembly factor BamE